MSTQDIRRVLGEYWQIAVKAIAIAGVAVYTYANMPTKGDIDRLSQSIHSARTDAENKLAERPTRPEVVQLLQGPDNPYTGERALVMRVVNAYDADQRDTQKLLQQILVELGVLRELQAPRKARR